MSNWDISRLNEWKCDEFPLGAVIPESGNSRDYVTAAGGAIVRSATMRSARSAFCAGSCARIRLSMPPTRRSRRST